MAQNKRDVYHGTTAAAAESICREQHFRESRADTEWLGRGVYFFQYAEHARRWIRNRNLQPGVVLTARLEYDDRELLDLDDPVQLNAVNQIMSKLNQRLRGKITIKPGEKYEKWKRWCFSCNTYRELCPEIGVISYTFPQSKEPGASGFPSNERQICVSKPELITAITQYSDEGGI